jgi:hypothetical protein
MADKPPTVFFVINLVQDVNIVRGLVYLAARETDAGIGFLVSQAFLKRDRQKIWQRELATIAAATRATMHVFGSPADAYAVIEGGGGLIFAASESNLTAHRETAGIFRIAPASYLRITLQHGFECIGFLQSREHVISHGRNISFSADVVCAWFDPESLTSLTASERAKLYVTGPPTLLQRPRSGSDRPPQSGGLVCENLHSVRLRASGDHKTSFMAIFFAFCAAMEKREEVVTLRPHPGGQYVLKNNVTLPGNVRLNSQPLSAFDMGDYRFGISAPSTIVFDMILSGLPVGLWRDPAGIMDVSNYAGLTEISTLDDWLAFERDVRIRPEMIIDRQKAFLRRIAMPLDPAEVYRRFCRLMLAALAGLAGSPDNPRQTGSLAALAGATAGNGARRPVVLANDVLVEVKP